MLFQMYLNSVFSATVSFNAYPTYVFVVRPLDLKLFIIHVLCDAYKY